MNGGSAGRRLPARSRAVLRALVPGVCPPDVVALGIVDAVVAHAEASWRTVPPIARRSIVATTYVLEVAARRWGAPGHALTPGQATRLAEDLLVHRSALARQPFRGVRDLLVIAYYEQRAVQQQLGYDPEAWVARTAARRAHRWGDAIAAHEAVLAAPDPLPRPGDRRAADR